MCGSAGGRRGNVGSPQPGPGLSFLWVPLPSVALPGQVISSALATSSSQSPPMTFQRFNSSRSRTRSGHLPRNTLDTDRRVRVCQLKQKLPGAFASSSGGSGRGGGGGDTPSKLASPSRSGPLGPPHCQAPLQRAGNVDLNCSLRAASLAQVSFDGVPRERFQLLGLLTKLPPPDRVL